METDQERHCSFLKMHCRLCGCSFAERKNKSESRATYQRTTFSVKSSYKDVVPYRNLILELYQQDVDLDDQNVHPTHFCSSCFSNLHKHLVDEHFSSKIELVDWKEHGKECELCKKHTKGKAGGRPKKAKKGMAKHKENLAKQNSPTTSPMEAREQASKLVGKKNIQSDEGHDGGGIDPQNFADDTISPECICSLCGNVLWHPVQLSCCTEIMCKLCLEKWLKVCSMCPNCNDYSDETCMSDPSPSLLQDLYELSYQCQTCQSTVFYSNIYIHYPSCSVKSNTASQSSDPPPSKRGRPAGPSYYKSPLSSLKQKSSKRRRAAPLRIGLRSLVRLHKEEYGDTIKYLLIDYFEMCGRYAEARELTRFFDRKTFGMSARKCLALRVTCFQTKNQYQKRRQTVNASMDMELYKPLLQLNAEEDKLLPAVANFKLEDLATDHDFESVKTSGKEPIDIMSGFKTDGPDGYPINPGFIIPNMAGFRWRYDQAIAQTLVEYNIDIEHALQQKSLDPSDPEHILHCRIKDGSDGLGEMPVKVSKDVLPNKSLRYAFVLTHVWTIDSSGSKVTLYDEQQPNSEFWTRPLLVALCDENDPAAVGICHRPIEVEKNALQGAKMTITAENGNVHSYIIHIETKMMDEKLERVVKNYDASGSNYCCTLCEYNKATDSHVTGPVPITRNSNMTTDIGQELQFNASDGHLRSQEAMKLYAKGVKSGKPLMKVSDILDSTHATINTAELIEKIYDHEISQETSNWNASLCDKEKLAEAKEARLNTLKRELGRNRGLMMKGNLGRVLYSKRCEDILVPLIPSPERQNVMRTFLTHMRDLRRVWVATHPDCSPAEISNYNTIAEELGAHLREHFDYVTPWTNYLHKIISHGGELLEKYGTIGGDASEGNECQNKVFRYVHKHLSRNNSKVDIRDCLLFSWLYSSRILRRELVDPAKYTCGNCGLLGHNRRTCPELFFLQD